MFVPRYGSTFCVKHDGGIGELRTASQAKGQIVGETYSPRKLAEAVLNSSIKFTQSLKRLII
jgi:hypothetical protein